MKVLLFAVLSVFALSVLCEDVITPFGYRLKQCVVEVPSGSTVSEHGSKLKIVLPEADALGETVKFFDVPAECHDDIERVRQHNIRKRQARTTEPTFPFNGWLDYSGWYPPSGENDLQKFTSTYTVPGNPASPNGGQVLFYFIGMQDNDASAVNIIQPVLTWGNGLNEWYVKSWACCPSNITVSSPSLTGLKAGDEMSGYINRISDSTWEINSIFQGKHTELKAQVGDYNYNWADVTLEVYKVDNCQEFANGPATFGDLAIFDKQGNKITPTWKYTAPTACQGVIKATNADTIIIKHND